MDKLKELLDKIKKIKFNGKIEVYINSGGIVGIKLFREEKMINKRKYNTRDVSLKPLVEGEYLIPMPDITFPKESKIGDWFIVDTRKGKIIEKIDPPNKWGEYITF